MAFDDLARVDLAELVEKQRAQASLWGFIHVPKTAGTSLIAALRSVYKPYRNILPKTYHAGPQEFDALVWEAVEEFVGIQLDPDQPNKAKWFSGHLARSHSDYITARLPGTRLFTFLRDPVEQVISNYRYCRTPRHPTHEAFSAKYPTLMDYVMDRTQSNGTSSYLMADFSWKRTTTDEVVSSVTRKFRFIGLADNYAASLSIICAMLGVSDVALEKLNATIDTEDNTFEVGADVIDAIRSMNALDEALYRHVRALLLPKLGAWTGVSSSPPAR